MEEPEHKSLDTKQPAEAKRQVARFVIGGLLVVLALGGFVM
jgi:hypothetical protein